MRSLLFIAALLGSSLACTTPFSSPSIDASATVLTGSWNDVISGATQVFHGTGDAGDVEWYGETGTWHLEAPNPYTSSNPYWQVSLDLPSGTRTWEFQTDRDHGTLEMWDLDTRARTLLTDPAQDNPADLPEGWVPAIDGFDGVPHVLTAPGAGVVATSTRDLAVVRRMDTDPALVGASPWLWTSHLWASTADGSWQAVPAMFDLGVGDGADTPIVRSFGDTVLAWDEAGPLLRSTDGGGTWTVAASWDGLYDDVTLGFGRPHADSFAEVDGTIFAMGPWSFETPAVQVYRLDGAAWSPIATFDRVNDSTELTLHVWQDTLFADLGTLEASTDLGDTWFAAEAGMGRTTGSGSTMPVNLRHVPGDGLYSVLESTLLRWDTDTETWAGTAFTDRRYARCVGSDALYGLTSFSFGGPLQALRVTAPDVSEDLGRTFDNAFRKDLGIVCGPHGVKVFGNGGIYAYEG